MPHWGMWLPPASSIISELANSSIEFIGWWNECTKGLPVLLHAMQYLDCPINVNTCKHLSRFQKTSKNYKYNVRVHTCTYYRVFLRRANPAKISSSKPVLWSYGVRQMHALGPTSISGGPPRGRVCWTKRCPLWLCSLRPRVKRMT